MVRAGLIAGGMLVMIGAVLPWLTLYAGLQQYSGLIGLYGRTAFALGILACIAGAFAPAKWRPLLLPASAAAGIALLALGVWLYEGVLQIVQRPDSAMVVPQSGSGLFVMMAGGALLVAAPIGSYFNAVRPLRPRPIALLKRAASSRPPSSSRTRNSRGPLA